MPPAPIPDPLAPQAAWASLAELAADFGLRAHAVAKVLRQLGAVPTTTLAPVPAVVDRGLARRVDKGWEWDRQAWGAYLQRLGATRLPLDRRAAFVLARDMADAVFEAFSLEDAGDKMEAINSVLRACQGATDITRALDPSLASGFPRLVAMELIAHGFGQDFAATLAGMVVQSVSGEKLDPSQAQELARQAHADLLAERLVAPARDAASRTRL